MSASTRRLNSGALAVAALLAAAGCVREEERVPVITSIDVTITAPTDLGSETDRLPGTSSTVDVDIAARDDLGQQADLDGLLDVQVHFLGTLTRTNLTVELVDGQASATLVLPKAYGPTYMWIEDSLGDAPTYATGTSETLWFRDPLVEDVSLPDLMRPATWLWDSPLEQKQVRIAASKHGASGRLIVTGVYSQGYTISDVDCSASPCVADPFNHLYVFTFGRPRDENFTAIELGHQVAWVSGGVGEFLGFTELNFPQTGLVRDTADVDDDGDTDEPLPPDESLLPEPVVVQPAWLVGAQDPDGQINMEEVEAGLIAVENGILCPLDEDFTEFSQWKLDVGLGCGTPVNVVTAGAVSTFDITDYAPGTIFARVVGTLRCLNFDSGGSIFILQPRRSSDLTQ